MTEQGVYLIWSALISLAASFVIWLLVTKCHPRIKVSEKISMTKSAITDTLMFRIKVENLSIFNVYDISLSGRIYVYGMVEKQPDKFMLFIASVGSGKHPFIESILKNKQAETTGREFLVRPTKIAKKQLLSKFPNIAESENSINIENILKLDERNKLAISISCEHGFTRARKLFHVTYKAGKNTFVNGYFMPKGLHFMSEGEKQTHSEDEICAGEKGSF